MRKNITIVTALYEMGRENLQEGFGRKFDHYTQHFKQLLSLDFPMIIYCDESLNEFVWKHRKRENTNIINKTLDSFKTYPHYAPVQTIRTDATWYSQAGWLRDSPQAQLEFYNPLVMAKQFLLNDASIFNTFKTKYFLWLDAGITNTVNVVEYFKNERVVRSLTKCMNKMLYIAFPYETTTEVHGFKKPHIDKFAESDVRRVVRGGMFGGTRDSIAAINVVYYHMLDDTLKHGSMGTEESVFSILSYRYPHLINLQMINSDGLIYTFFENLIKESSRTVMYDDEISIYSLTYNSPKQFELWAKTFKAAYPELFDSSPKYVLNNSDDSTVKAEYQKLFKFYGFKEIQYNNIGIMGGRIEIAKHFSRTKSAYMVFFEDDMLIRTNQSIESGLTVSFKSDVFDVVKEIVESENLDYMKLSFDEVYGNNATNWAWHHTPVYKKSEYFPEVTPRTKIHYIETTRSVPYAVGDFFYCNWPILFTQQGNAKIFLNDTSVSKHEGAYMYRSLELFSTKELTAGCILGSLVIHNRKYDYNRANRKES